MGCVNVNVNAKVVGIDTAFRVIGTGEGLILCTRVHGVKEPIQIVSIVKIRE